ncbi:MAG TPA: hypothetical protein DCE81_06340 [Cytophagales bacterium]|nr:hypothetical protein [Cytophagales bacterium]
MNKILKAWPFLLVVTSVSIPMHAQPRPEKTIDSLQVELERAKAVAKHFEENYHRVLYLFTAKEMALRSHEISDPNLRGLVSVQAQKFQRDYNGDPRDPEIYQALFSALTKLDSSAASDFPPSTTAPDYDSSKGKLIAKKICSYQNRNLLATEWERLVGDHLPYESTCPY